MNYQIDFSLIDSLELRKLGITQDEVRSVFSSQGSKAKSYSNFDYLIGFSQNRKFIHAAYRYSPSIDFDLELLQVDLPYEEDIEKYWCKG